MQRPRRPGLLLLSLLALLLAPASLLVAFAELNLALAGQRLDEWWYRPDPVPLAQAARQIDRARAWSIRRGALELRRGEMLLAQSLSARDNGKLSSSIRALQQSIQHRPLWPETHGWLAVALARAGERERAAQSLDRALSLGPHSGRLLTILRPHVAAVAPIVGEETRAGLFRLANHTAHGHPDWSAEVMARFGWHYPWCDQAVDHDLAEVSCRRLGWAPD